ncbi:MAG: DEAD/DEAH box helicase [Rhizobiales bacterium]|nr:DEAD/DEAH box helicase [Hyphomicrobiales bacterium]
MPVDAIEPALLRALTAKGYAKLTPVQSAVLAPEASDRDLLVSARTGSGKTVAFGLAVAPTLLEGAETLPRAAEPLALVVAPTRELALQVQRELEWLYAQTGAKVVSCVGGMEMRAQRRALEQGVHIVVGTPGRLRDHLERGSLDASHLRAVILDEADEMLDLGFREDLEFILDAAPAERRTLLFSATVAKPIATLAKTFQKNALRLATANEQEQHADIEYQAMRIAPTERDHAVVNVLRYFGAPGALVFCATREGVKHLHSGLTERGFAAVALSGELSQGERTHALQALRDGRATVCVATDVAARGIDLPNLDLVIHADLPQNREALLHRSGRTGRAGRKGTCVVLVAHNRRKIAERMLSAARLHPKWGTPPSISDIRQRDHQRMMENPVLTDTPTEEDQTLARALLEVKSPEEIAIAFAKLYSATLPAAEEMLDAPFSDPRPNDRGDRGDRGERREPKERPNRNAMENGVWFKMTVGRQQNAEPRWLLPLICRRGHVTKKEIGSIKILDRESRVEIAGHIADRFEESVNRVDIEDGSIHFTRMKGNEPAPKSAPRPDPVVEKLAEAMAEAKPTREEKAEKPASFDKPKNDDKPYGKKPEGKKYQDKKYQGKGKPKFDGKPGWKDKAPSGDKPHSNKSRDDKPREYKPRDEKPREYKPREEAKAAPQKPKGDLINASKRPDGSKPVGKKFAGRKPVGKKPDGKKPGGKGNAPGYLKRKG